MNFKKLMSFLLSAVMIFTLVPTAAFAEGEEATATSEITSYAIHASATPAGEYKDVLIADPNINSLTVKQGESIYLKLYDGTNYLSSYENVTLTLPNSGDNSKFAISEYTVDENNKCIKLDSLGYAYSNNMSIVKITVGDITVDIQELLVPYILKYATSLEATEWATVPDAGLVFDAAAVNEIYVKAYSNGSSANISGVGLYNSESAPVLTNSETHLTIKPGEKDGTANAYLTSNGIRNDFSIIITNTVAEEPTITPIVKSANVEGGVVEFTDVTGDLVTNESGFSVAENKLCFDTTGKAAGYYEATVGTQPYVVVVFPSATVSGIENADNRKWNYKDVTPALSDFGTMSNDGYYILFNEETSGNSEYGMHTINGGDFGVKYATEDIDIGIKPFYIYKIKDNTVVSMTNEGVICGSDWKDFWTVTSATVNNTDITVYKVVPNYDKYKKSNHIEGTFTIVGSEQSTPPQFRAFVSDMNKESNLGNFEFVTDIQPNSKYDRLYIRDRKGDTPTTPTFYLLDNTGNYVSYEAIDISSLKLEGTDPSFVNAEFIATTVNGKKAIGVKLSVKSTAEVKMEEIKLSFKTIDKTEYFVYGETSCIPDRVVENEYTVSKASELEYYYNNSIGNTVIYLENGEYSLDLVHSRSDVSLIAKGDNVVFNGEEGSNEPIIKIESSDPGKIEGIIIDGRNQTKDGIASTAQGTIYATDNLTIRNCNVGVQKDNGGAALWIAGCTFENNNIAVITGSIGPLQNAHIINNIFVDNGIAILHKSHVNTAQIKNNVFKTVENTVNPQIDLKTEISAKIDFTQNYFDKTENGGVPSIIASSTDVTPTVYYSPFYINESRTVLGANLAGAEPSPARATTVNYTLPVDLSVKDNDGNLVNTYTKFDNRLFNEMKSTNSLVAVEIPVTENVAAEGAEPDVKISTIWGFDNSEGNIAATLPSDGMDLKVTSVPSSEAETIVANTVENTEDIVQYVNFSHNGTLPGKATVKVLASTVSDVSELKLYYINETTGEVETAEICDVELVEIDGEKYYVVTVDHCSEYIITTGVVAKDNSDGGETGGDDTTGGESGGETGGSTTPSTTPAPSATTAPTATPAAKPTTSATTDPAVNDFVSAVEISDKLENANTSEVIVDVTDKNLVSPKAFELLAEHPEKTIVFKGEKFSISFAGKDLTNPDVLGDKTFDTTVSLESPNEGKIKTAAGNADIINVYFNHHGKLPGKATVRVFAGTEHAGLEKHVHYFNSEDNSFEYISTIAADASGWAEFTIEHCSDYVLSDVILDTSVNTETEEPNTEKEENAQHTVTEPEENKSSPLPIIIIIAVAVITAAVILLKKKNKED